MSAEPSKGWE
jgi:hypothetical protein